MTVTQVDYKTILRLINQLPTRQRFALAHDILQSLESSLPQRESALPYASGLSANAENGSVDDETEWLYAAAHNPVFQYLYDPAEDIYAITDGEPIHGTEV
jgi:hypothetical protein